MNICFYDNNEIVKDTFGNVEIDRVYCIDFERLSQEDWKRLSDLYKTLPKQIIIDNIEQQMWFGEEGKSDFYLWTSVEPSGLQVSGYLRFSDWCKWVQIFNKVIEQFPLNES